MTEANRTIGHIARSASVNIETVRYYQRRGLMGRVVRLGSRKARLLQGAELKSLSANA
jgi:DNA-binding transcriptional MerR regulator